MKTTKLLTIGLLCLIISLPVIAKPVKDSLHNNNGNANASPAVNTGTMTASVNTIKKDATGETNLSNDATDNPVITYRIQILALTTPIKVEKVTVNGIDAEVYTQETKGVTRYYMGEAHDLISAFGIRDEMKNEGFQDAIIVAFKNNERITIKESLPLLGDN